MISFDQYSVTGLIDGAINQLSILNDRLAIVGLITCGYVTIRLSCKLIGSLNEHFSGAICLKRRLSKYGKWAGECIDQCGSPVIGILFNGNVFKFQL